MKRVKDSKLCEEFAKEKGYINLDWLCPENIFKENKKGDWEEANARFVLYGRPENYKGDIGDYREPIIAEIVKHKPFKRVGFRWVLYENGFGIAVGKFVMN